MKTLLFQGDSITDCGRAANGGAGYPLNLWGPGYPGLIASQLMGDQPGQWEIINRGISGNRVVDLYARWRIDALNLNPDIISILIGVNDTWHETRQNGVEVPRYDKFYRMLLDWTLEVLPDTKFILMEPFVLPFGAVEESWLAEIKERQEVVRKIAEDYKTVFVPLQQPLNDALKLAPQEYWLVDGVHPQPAGHRLIQKEWLKAAADLIK
ncbi:MAG: SGNH/GDSL hydrolase family protein [Lentisphaeria bacterium]|nr:SGNH/GDSL hydrolase family protein [Lentisphaeria bacterium]MBQ8753882.1 SGNH/GDSL hydrolase family protein [Lentisphaeria bacterium]